MKIIKKIKNNFPERSTMQQSPLSAMNGIVNGKTPHRGKSSPVPTYCHRCHAIVDKMRIELNRIDKFIIGMSPAERSRTDELRLL